jgi:hypothetical protein
VKRWPPEHGGGVRGVVAVLDAVAAVARTPLPPSPCPRDALILWQQALYTDGIVAGILLALRAVSNRFSFLEADVSCCSVAKLAFT